jgi:hypothetical protein
MIDAIRSYSQHTLIGVIAEGAPALLDSLNALVNRVALSIIIQVVISIPLFYLHHNLFALGFVVGFVFDKQVRMLVDKVNTVYNAQRTLLERVLFFGGGGFLAILTMPTSMVIATLYYSSQWGAVLYQNSLTRYSRVPSERDSGAEIDLEGEIHSEDELDLEQIVIENPTDKIATLTLSEGEKLEKLLANESN